MHSLSELKSFFEQNNVKVKEFSGWYLIVKKDKWTMLDDEYYVNGDLIKRKEIGKFYKGKSK
jgi:hypothetical protein